MNASRDDSGSETPIGIRAVPRTFQQAKDHHRGGRIDLAETLYRQILYLDPGHAGALHLLGVAALQRGRSEAALESIRQAVTIEPATAAYYLSLGQAYIACRHTNDAIAAYRRATALAPELVDAWFGLGIALQTSGEITEAIAVYRRLLAIEPGHAEALNNLGSALEYHGEFDAAIAAYRRALALEPLRAATHNNLGSALHRRGQLEEALAACRRGLELDPNSAAGWNNLGLVLTAARRLDEAVAALRQALTLTPDFAEGWYNLANALKDRGEFRDAVAANRRAVALAPQRPEIHINLGNALQALGEFEEAANSYRRALVLRPDDVEAHNNLGTALWNLKQFDASLAELRRCVALRPDFHVGYCNLGNSLKDVGLIQDAVEAYRQAVELCPSDAISHSNFLFSIQYHPEYSAEDNLRECCHFQTLHAAGLHDARRHKNDRDPDRRLRIGYLGADFREHCQSLFTIPLFSNHDRKRFELLCYADVPRPDAVTERIRGLVDAWRPIAGRSDREVAETVRVDRIDILIDLTMHMSHGRPLVMARKPAPVQVAYLAYPGTTGLAAVDYRLSDPHLDPPGLADAHYSEKTLRLPETFWCYDPLCEEPTPGPLPALSEKRITFGCLNNFCKVSAQTVALWSRVLDAVAGSRLLLLSPAGEHRGRICDQFRRENIDPARIDFVEHRPRSQYLELYRRIDICLDTIPYNGHTTSLDSFWMGSPVVTRVGPTVVGRAGLSQLTNLGLSELAAANDEDFVTAASKLSTDLPRLAELRATLRGRMERSPLMNASRFARHLEATYRHMWREWCAVRP